MSDFSDDTEREYGDAMAEGRLTPKIPTNSVREQVEIILVNSLMTTEKRIDAILSLITEAETKARVSEIEYWFGVYIEHPREAGQNALIDVNDVEERRSALAALKETHER